MMRWIAMLGLAGLLASPAAAQAQETYSVKLKKSTTGTVAKVEKKDDGLESFKVTDNDGNKIQEVNKKKAAQFQYNETIVEKVEGARRPIRLKRTYQKAIAKTDDGDLILPFQGKTVVIEKKDGKFHFNYENGDALPDAAAKTLDEEFNKKKDDDVDFHHVLLPMNAVKVGESWDLPADAIGKAMEEKDGKVKFNHDKSTGKGKLVKAYKKDGQQYGVVTLRLELTPLSFKGDDGNEIKVQPDAKLVIDLTIDGCIDGSVTTAKTSIGFNVNAVAHIPNADMPQARIVLNLRASSQVNEQEVKK